MGIVEDVPLHPAARAKLEVALESTPIAFDLPADAPEKYKLAAWTLFGFMCWLHEQELEQEFRSGGGTAHARPYGDA